MRWSLIRSDSFPVGFLARCRRLMEWYVLFGAESPQWNFVIEHVRAYRGSVLAEEGAGESSERKKT
jgi:hypothetical protein